MAVGGSGESTAKSDETFLPLLPRPQEVVSPRAFVSSDGQFSLEVWPSDQNGVGGATYKLRTGTESLWSMQHPFTLVNVCLTQAGEAIGYAYSHGIQGRVHGDGYGDFQVVILDRSGKVRLRDRVERTGSRFLHEPPSPIADGLIVHEEHDHFFVQLLDPDVNRRQPTWWSYQISTGTKNAEVQPPTMRDEHSSHGFVIAAKPIAGTPLTIVHQSHSWSGYGRDGNDEYGARFFVVDQKGRLIWNKLLRHDYQVAHTDSDAKMDGENEKINKSVRNRIFQFGGILPDKKSMEFELYFARDSRRVTYRVERSAEQNSTTNSSEQLAWNVTEVANEPSSLPQIATAKQDQALRETLRIGQDSRIQVAVVAANFPSLKPLSSIELAQREPESPIHSIYHFAGGGPGRLAFIRSIPGGQNVFVLVGLDGELVLEFKLPEHPAEGRWQTCWLQGDTFLVTVSPYGVEQKSTAWVLDTKSESLSKLDAFDCDSIDDLARLPDGGFAALATARYEYTMVSGLHGFSPDGRSRWHIEQDYSKGPQALFSPEAITLTSSGEVAVLDNIRDSLQYFSPQGQFLRSVDLKEAWGREPNYPTDLATTPDGLVVYDFDAAKPYVRVDSEGKQQSWFQPRQADGRVVDCADFETDSRGFVWVTDRHALLRLDSQGVVDRIIGAQPDPNQLRNVAMLEIDRLGKRYVVDQQSATIHVMNADWQLQHRCVVSPDDFRGELFQPLLTVTDDGDVSVCVSTVGRRGHFVRFSKTGEPIVVPPSQEWKGRPGPGTRTRIIEDYDSLFWIETDDSGKRTKQKITARPDGHWFERIIDVRFDDDGCFAVLAESDSLKECSINLFDASANPQKVIVLPKEVGDSPKFDYREKYLAVIGNSILLWMDLDGRMIARNELQPDRTKLPSPKIVPGKHELILSPGRGTSLVRFELP
ncbi:hypothetical protein [Rubripirellula obstinata]|nr:hypothetical protein [Rubripirellula obstinata]